MRVPTPSLAALNGLPVTKASLRFIHDSETPKEERPYHFSGPLDDADEPQRTNICLVPSDVLLRDVRDHLDKLDLDGHGFKILHCPSKYLDGIENQEVLDQYLNEVAEILKDHFDPELVACYDFRFRKSGDKAPKEAAGSVDSPNEPAWQVHVDQTQDGGLRRAARHLSGSEAKKYLDGTWRVRILNVWRPLNGPVRDAPLSYCDYTSVDFDDLIAVDRPSREYVGQTYYLRYNPSQRWYWVSDQTTEEVSLFMSYDSELDKEVSSICPHTAFRHTEHWPAENPRESIEVRAIVFTKIQE